jgi:hypothetical protein
MYMTPLLQIIIAAVGIFLIADFYRRLLDEKRRFKVVLFLLQSTHNALFEKKLITREELYTAQKKTLYSMAEPELGKTKRDLRKEGIDIQS